MTKKKVPCDVYSRVVGYITPVQLWNRGKKQEYKERAEYKQRGRVVDSSDIDGRDDE